MGFQHDVGPRVDGQCSSILCGSIVRKTKVSKQNPGAHVLHVNGTTGEECLKPVERAVLEGEIKIFYDKPRGWIVFENDGTTSQASVVVVVVCCCIQRVGKRESANPLGRIPPLGSSD